jgi:putative tricarboxylic transport membrane protein
MGFINSKDRVGTSLFLLFSLCYLNFTFEIPLNTVFGGEQFTARTMPIGLSVTAIIFCLIHLFLPTQNKQNDIISEAVAGFEWRLCFSLILLMLAYGLTFKFLGFALGTFLFLVIGFFIMGERRILLSVSIAAGLVVFMWAMLTQLFELYLDSGDLFRLVTG